MNTQKQQTVLLGITGSIAAYKACELLRLYQKAGLRIKVVMTRHAQKLVGAATFRALSNEPVAIDLFEDPRNAINHISLAEEADVMVIAPCTANVINKIANGIADDLLTTTALATTAPMVIAPAMNVNMLRNAHTQESLRVLEASGVAVIGPGEGYLACGTVDSGRMSEPAEILAATLEIVQRKQSLAGKRVLITAGATREFLDPVRFISSPASGKTGFALAREAALRGAKVVLISAPTELLCPPGVSHVPVVSAVEMLQATETYFDQADIAVFSAAVADFRPAGQVDHKLKKGVDLPAVDVGDSLPQGSVHDETGSSSTYDLQLTTNPDILATLAARRNALQAQKPFIVGFAAETEDVLKNAQTKLKTKGANLIVANDVSNPRIGFGSTNNKVTFVSEQGVRATELMSKDRLAQVILDEVLKRL